MMSRAAHGTAAADSWYCHASLCIVDSSASISLPDIACRLIQEQVAQLKSFIDSGYDLNVASCSAAGLTPAPQGANMVGQIMNNAAPQDAVASTAGR